MSDENDVLDREVAQVLEERLAAAGDPLPWDSVVSRPVTAGSVADVAVQSSGRARWMLVAASLLLVVGVIAGLSIVAGGDNSAVGELPPPRLEEVVMDGAGPTRPLSSIVPGDVVVPTLLFEGLLLEPVVVYDQWRSQWFAHTGRLDMSASDPEISVRTGMDGEQGSSPDVELTAGGVDWGVRSFGAEDHQAFASFDRLGVSVSVSGMAFDDFVLLLDGLRSADPDAHPASTFDVESDGVEVARSANGSHRLDVASVGEWLCWEVRPIDSWPGTANCAIPDPQPDGSMLLNVTLSQLTDPDPDGSRRTEVFTIGFVPGDALGADIVHADGTVEFARAEGRSGNFDERFVLGLKSFDDIAELDDLDRADVMRLIGVELSAVFADE